MKDRLYTFSSYLFDVEDFITTAFISEFVLPKSIWDEIFQKHRPTLLYYLEHSSGITDSLDFKLHRLENGVVAYGFHVVEGSGGFLNKQSEDKDFITPLDDEISIKLNEYNRQIKLNNLLKEE